MQKLKIRGGTPLHGEVRISGAKNAALPILAAALLSAEPLVLANVPRLNDIDTMLKLLGQMGAVTMRDQEAVTMHADKVSALFAPYDLVKTMRASILVLDPLVARFGEARVSLPCGCAIGARMVDLHVKGLKAIGATITIEAGYIHATAKRLKGARIFMDTVTVTGSENIRTAPYPALPTDMQAQLIALNCVSSGTGVVTETIFENRFMQVQVHVQELVRPGCQHRYRRQYCHCPRRRSSRRRGCHGDRSARRGLPGDRRPIVEGEAVIDRIYHLDRGYDHIEQKLSALGAQIERAA